MTRTIPGVHLWVRLNNRLKAVGLWLSRTSEGPCVFAWSRISAVSGLEPLTLTRPVHELLLGTTTLASKIIQAFRVGPGPQQRSCVVRSHLVGVQRLRDPHTVVNDRDWLARGPVLVANGRWVPAVDFEPPERTVPGWGFATVSRRAHRSGPRTLSLLSLTRLTTGLSA